MASWATGCATAGFCGTTAADTASGLQKVEVSIRRDSNGLYWNGSFSSAAQVFNLATGTSGHRGLTYFENDDRLRSTRQVYGDFVESTGDLGGSAFLGGVASARAFDLARAGE